MLEYNKNLLNRDVIFVLDFSASMEFSEEYNKPDRKESKIVGPKKKHAINVILQIFDKYLNDKGKRSVFE